MTAILIILKLFFLFIGALFSISNGYKYGRGHGLSGFEVFLQAFGIVGFCVLQFALYK